MIGRNVSLGVIIHELHLLADEPERDLQYMGLMQFSLMLACVGLPFSGTYLLNPYLTPHCRTDFIHLII